MPDSHFPLRFFKPNLWNLALKHKALSRACPFTVNWITPLPKVRKEWIVVTKKDIIQITVIAPKEDAPLCFEGYMRNLNKATEANFLNDIN